MTEQPPVRRFEVELIDEAPKPRLGTPAGRDESFMQTFRHGHEDHDHDDHDHDDHGHDPAEGAPDAASRAAGPKDDPAAPKPGGYLDNFLITDDHAASAEAVLMDDLVAALRDIYDPEIPVNIYDLGLIYNVETDGGHVVITMTLTTPHCPVAESMPGEVEMRILAVPGVATCDVNLVWDPPWNPSNMSDEARLELGML